MGKKLVGLYVPAVQMHFDIMAPDDMPVHALTELLTKGTVELSEGRFVPSLLETLSVRCPDMLLHPERTLADYGVEDGAQMVLI